MFRKRINLVDLRIRCIELAQEDNSGTELVLNQARRIEAFILEDPKETT